MLYPAWRAVGPPYGYLVAKAYSVTAPLWEHPQRTRAVAFEDGTTYVLVEGGRRLAVTQKNLFVDLPILLALIVCSPGLSPASRLRMSLLGFIPLGLTHFSGFALVVQLAHAEMDLSGGVIPGPLTLYLAAPLRRLIYSDWVLLLPFVVWGAIYSWEMHRAGAERTNAGKPNSKPRRRAARRRSTLLT